MQTLQRAEEFARLYGVGSLSQQTLLELMGVLQSIDRSPPPVYESTPSRRPNVIMQHWLDSVTDTIAAAHSANPRGVMFTLDSLPTITEG